MAGMPEFPRSTRLDADGLDDLAPLLGFLSEEPAEVSGRARKDWTGRLGQPRLDLGIGEPALISLLSLSIISLGVFLGAPIRLTLSTKSPVPKERLRVSYWIVQRLYNYAINETVEL